MVRVGEFIYPWGNGHYSRMSRLNDVLPEYLGNDLEIHYSSKGDIYDKLLAALPKDSGRVHKVMMPTPIDGRMGPDIWRCMANIAFPVAGNPPLVRQIASYLREERRIYDASNFDLVINDGDMGSNVLADTRNIPCLFITNQFRPRLWPRRFYFYPGLEFVSRQIAKATRIIVADSPPPYTMCEFNLNFPKKVLDKVAYVGHFSRPCREFGGKPGEIERMVAGGDFGYWMRTGNKSTNDGTGERYEDVFHDSGMRRERRVVSHARDDPAINSVLGRDGRRYTIREAYDRKVDWLQIDVGFLSEREKEAVLNNCLYAVVNGSHTVMGEILGEKRKPVIGMPVYDEHTNNIRWAQERGLGILATRKNRVIEGIGRIRRDMESFLEALDEFGRNFVRDGARNTAEIAAQTLQEKR